MLNFEEYKKRYLNELNRTTEYYRDRPGEIKDFSYTDENADNKRYFILRDIIREKNKVYEKLENDIISYESKYKSDFNECFCDNKLNIKPQLSRSYFDMSGYKEYCDLNKPITKEYKHLTPYKDKVKSAIDYYDNYLYKLGIKHGGLNLKTVIDALLVLIDWRRASIKDIDEKTLKSIHKLTVDDTNIPRIIYRGFKLIYRRDFGDIIDHKGKKANIYFKKLVDGIEQNKLKIGDTFKYDFGNATSWSTDIGTASKFSTYNSKANYNLIISYKPKKEDIVADLRNVDISNITDYHHQSELVLAGGEYDFSIVKIEKNDVFSNRSTNINKNMLHYNIKDSYIQDSSLRILTLNKYKSITDKQALELADEFVKPNMTMGKLFSKYKFSFENKYKSRVSIYTQMYNLDKSNDDVMLRNTHPRIASYFYLCEFDGYVDGFDDYIIVSDSENDIIKLIIKDKKQSIELRIKFYNHTQLFKQMNYKIIDDIDNNREKKKINKFLNNILTTNHSFDKKSDLRSIE